ncbi:MAG: 16S rRNA (adenine(1518)-N(6)/adenine(1519)-N(6))-dimethyltransferase RsmA [Marinifilaceae bacterium]
MIVRAKKKLGQHFLKDQNVALNICTSLIPGNYDKILEIGPGMGVLTQYLFKNKDFETFALDIDSESIEYLHNKYPDKKDNIIFGDFLKQDVKDFSTEPFAVIGNFPYNISSQIFFKVLENKELIPQVVCMIQKEVAERIAAKHGNKTYGILSVLLQAYYNIEYLFTVHENVFDPPPRVKSGVIRLIRNERTDLGVDPKFFKTVVKTGFGQRRKTLRNSLKALLQGNIIEHEYMTKRPEQLSVDQLIELTAIIENVLRT